MRVKSSGMARGLANARPPGSAKFANAPLPGLTRRANAPQLPGGGGGGAQVELTDAFNASYFQKNHQEEAVAEIHSALCGFFVLNSLS